MINSDRKLLGEDYFIFCNNLKSPYGAFEHIGYNPIGGNSDGGNDEAIIVALSKISENV